ncbi:lipopolysaccharide export system permease protein [Azospirillum fermentarium]|uniref:LPS export ABC transporter permease LptF n=1 Tax=Azospirillum fermentarium TaxID=1233114 RepID=UPI002227EFB6|nr:LPS export ABC transporter permease LptF [Azospirillum fermentarium]MCW2248174.1 lipopolysaccharide export system permease protein [Azospirillum fermentarium]
MKRLERYLFRLLALATLYSTAGLTITIWLSQSLRLIEMVVEAGAPISVFLWLLLLTVPTFLGLVLPIALVAGVMFTYNKLNTDSELVVMRSAGMGPLALARPAIVLALIVGGIVGLLNVWLTPAAHRELARLEYAVRNDYSQLFIREGVFNDVSDRLSIYVRERDSDGTFTGILIHDARVAHKPVSILGRRAAIIPTAEGMRFVVFDGNRQEMDETTRKLSQLYFESYAIELKIYASSSGSGGPRQADARERSTDELLHPPPDVQANTRLLGNLTAELHQRFSAPLLSVAFTMLALASMLSGEFNRRGQSGRVAVAMVMVVVVQASAIGLTSLAGRNPAVIPLMYAMPMVVLAGGLMVLLRGRIHRAVRG